MRRVGRLVIVSALAVAVAALATTTYLATRNTSSSPIGAVASDVAAKIPTSGATLSAEVVTPQGKGKMPLIVMPGGWGQAATGYHAIAIRFAQRGYLVVAYAQRGFPASTGEVDFAGADSQHDVTTVISWALAHTSADRQRVGVFGTSYGAGVSLLAAARDPRIKAVAALSTWADVGQSFDPGHTPSTAALATLIGAPKPKARFGATIQSLRSTLETKPKEVGTATRAISTDRSPANYVTQLNKNHPAIMLANAFEDSIFPPGQLVPFFTALTTPKRLEFAAGDHGGPELSAFTGGPDPIVDDALAWFDHFLRGTDNGIEKEDPIVLRDVASGQLHSFKTWPKATGQDQIKLGPPGVVTAATGSVDETWTATVRAGTDSGASSGQAQLFSSSAYVPPRVAVAAIQKKNAFVWSGPTLTTNLELAGTPALRLQLGSSSGSATVFLYLYDVGTDGVGNLVDVQPYTATGLPRGKTRSVDIPMQPISWTVPSGDHLALVIDTVDARYQSLTPAGSTITVASSSAHPAAFVAPAPG